MPCIRISVVQFVKVMLNGWGYLNGIACKELSPFLQQVYIEEFNSFQEIKAPSAKPSKRVAESQQTDQNVSSMHLY